MRRFATFAARCLFVACESNGTRRRAGITWMEFQAFSRSRSLCQFLWRRL